MGAPKNFSHEDKTLSYKRRYELLLKLHNESTARYDDEIVDLENLIQDREDELTQLHDEIDELVAEMNNSRE